MATDPSKPSVLRFGIFELDYRSGALSRAGVAVRLPPQPFKVLWLLASRPGEVVSREEIRQALWGDGTYVDFDSGLNFCINQIRRALRDSAESPRFIHTLPRRGYRFLATVEMVRPPLDEAEMPEVAVSGPGLALLTSEDESAPPRDGGAPLPLSRREREIRPVVVERVRPIRWPAADPPPPRAEEPASPPPPVPPPRTGRWARLRGRVTLRGTVGFLVVLALVAGAAVLGAAFAAARGAGRHPTFQRVTFRRGTVQAARLGRDGSLVYSARWDGGPAEAYLGYVGAPEARPMGAGKLLAVLPSGEILAALNRGGSPVMAQLSPSGAPPRELMTGVGSADWSASGGGRIAVVRRDGTENRLEYPSGRVLLRTASALTHLRVAPDGRHVAFLDHPVFGDDRGGVAVADEAGTVRRLTADFASAEGLAWSADGREVWFTAAQTGLDAVLYAVDLSGRLREVLRAPGRLVLHDVGADGRALIERSAVRFELRGRFPGAGERDLSWLDSSMPTDLSADGGRLVFCESGEGGGPGYGVYLRDTDGAAPVRLGGGMASTLSPDGRWVAAMALAGPPRLLLLPTAAGETRVLASPGLGSYTGVGWTPDARTVVFAARNAAGALRLYAQAIDGAPAREVSPLAIRGARRFPVSPEGGRVAVGVVGGGVAIVPLDGGAEAPVPGTGPDDRPIGFSADGTALHLHREGTARIERITLATGERAPVADLAPADSAGAIGPLSPIVTPDGHALVWGYARKLSELYVVTGVE